MKKVILCSVLAAAAISSMNAQAASSSFCSGGAATNGVAASAGTSFIKQAFTPKCSTNVYLVGDEVSVTSFAVGAASAKGKTFFGGSSEGGAVQSYGTCAATGCTLANAVSGSTYATGAAASTAASSAAT